MNILFEHLTDNKELIFTIFDMPEQLWVRTERKHTISHEEYLRVCEMYAKKRIIPIQPKRAYPFSFLSICAILEQDNQQIRKID